MSLFSEIRARHPPLASRNTRRNGRDHAPADAGMLACINDSALAFRRDQAGTHHRHYVRASIHSF